MRFIFILLLSLPLYAVETYHDISGLLHQTNENLLLVNDEKSTLIQYDFQNKKIVHSVNLYEDDSEVDLEAISSYKNKIYVTGSHSLARKTIKSKHGYDESLKRIRQVKKESSRYKVLRFHNNLDQPIHLEEASLLPILSKDPILSAFLKIPSKENGIDIEGMTIDNFGTLFFGFRGPVLRGNLTPILVINEHSLFSGSDNYSLKFVNLAGSGVREIIKVKNGFLILSGSVSDLQTKQFVYFWNGEDMLPSLETKGMVKKLKIINTENKAEGLTLIEEGLSSYHLYIAFDGPENGGITKIEVSK